MRQPLSVMRAAVYSLNQHLGLSRDEKARRYLGLLLREVEELNSVASNLATLAGAAVAERHVADLEMLVAAALERVETRPNVTIEAAVDPGEVLFCDSSQIRLALINVIKNSIQSMPGEGLVRIVCQHAGREARIVISDNGPGMTEEVRARATEPFFTTSCYRVGIGLTVAQRLVEACGGKLAIESTPGAGTTVTLTFPPY